MAAERKLHILVMTAEWQSALACIQSFGRKGHTVSIAAGGTRHPNHASIFVKNAFSLVEKALDERVRELMHVVESNAIDLVVPISDHDAILVAKAKQSFPENNAMIGSSLESVLVTGSRNRTTELCRWLGINTPKTIFATRDNAPNAALELGYPCFLKLSGTFSSLGVFEVSSEAELGARLKPIPSHVEMQLQAKVEGDFVGITAVAQNGKVLESFAFRADYIHSRAGTPAYSMRVRDDRLLDILSKITKALRWTGGIDLDLLQTKDGNLALLEINPRFSGTIVFALKVGIDLPIHYVNAKLGIERTETFRPSHQDADRFVSLLEETFYLKVSGETGRLKSMSFRSDDKWVDNAFWDDWRYSAALFEQVRRSLIRAD